MKDQVQLSDKTKLSMPIANLIGLIMIVASVVFMYSEITGRLTSLETSRELFESDLLKKSTQLPTDQEQYMLLEHLAGEVERVQEEIEENRANVSPVPERGGSNSTRGGRINKLSSKAS